MERSVIRGSALPIGMGNPGLRCAPSGLRAKGGGSVPPSPFSTGDQLFDLRQYMTDDHRNPCGSRVEPVTLIELGIGSDAGEEEWIQDGAGLGGKIRINRVERAAVFGAHIGGGHHTAQQD